MQDLYSRSPIRALASHLDAPLGAGEVGFILALPGMGKSALLVHVALETALTEGFVLHVSLRDSVDHVRAFYEQIVQAATRRDRPRDQSRVAVLVERHRMIHSYLDKDFSADTLRGSVQMLRQYAHFDPTLVVVDGVNAARAHIIAPALRALGEELGLPIWFTARGGLNEVQPAAWSSCDRGLQLTPDGTSVQITVLSDGEPERVLPVVLDPVTMLVLGEGSSQELEIRPAPRASDCTLYSGGATGSETAFGEAAARWGNHEVNFTFEGHKQARSASRYMLSPRELAAGDVSLVYVSRRLARTYSEGTLIRKVLQTLWHMVSRSQQVFVVGQIQEDGTVVGGTGWSVELARMWNKALWVFDQDRDGWYRWDGDDWVAGTPVIESIHFSGTGTRYLKTNGREAIDALFRRSFAQD